MGKSQKRLTDLPSIGRKRAKVLESNNIISVEDVANTSSSRLVEIFAEQISITQAAEIIEQAKNLSSSASKTKRFWMRIPRHWGALVAVCGAILIFLQMPKAAIDLINETNEGVDVTISYAESLEKTYSGNADIFIDQRKSSVVNLGFPYRSLKDDKFALCGALPFLLETKSTLLIENLTIVFDIEFPSQDIFDLAKTAGYGNFVNTANNSCAYREKTHFKDDFGRTSLSRKFIHSNGRTRIAYQFENLLPGEPVPISIAIPLLPNTFLGFGDPIRQPFDEEPGNADFSNEALSNSEISLISHPISISISYIVNGPRQRAGNMLIYVHPGSVNADILFPSFLIANNDSFDKRRSLREIWSGEATNIIFQNLKTSLVTRKVIEDILDPEDTDLLSRQYFGKNINLELLPIGERILYVSDRSKVLASVGSLFSNSSDAMVFDMTNFNERRNMMRTELILSHQFPYLFQKYLEQKN